MKSKSLIGIFALVSLTMISCGKKESSDAYVNEIEIPENQNVKSFIKSVSLDNNTPTGIGTLIAQAEQNNPTKVELCTAFLINQNHVLTNSHCVPNYIKESADRSCKNKIFLVLKGSKDSIDVGCDKVVSFSKIKNNPKLEDDFAILKIDSKIALNEYKSISRSGIPLESKVKLQTMNHVFSADFIFSRYIEHTCLVKNSFFYNSVSNLSSSPITAFQEQKSTDYCKIVGGNSGSPVLNQDNKVVGIVHASANQTNVKLDRNPLLESLTSNVGILTNFRCAFFGTDLDSSIPELCGIENAQNIENNSEVNKNKLLSKSIESKIEKSMNDIAAELPQIGKFSNEAKNVGESSIHLTFKPTCLFPVSAWPTLYQQQVKKDFFGNQSALIALNAYKINVDIKFDYYGNVVVNSKATISGMNSFRMKNLDKLNSNGSADMTRIDINHENLTEQTKISSCK